MVEKIPYYVALLDLPICPTRTTKRAALTKMALPDTIPSLEKRKMSNPIKMPVTSLNLLLLSLIPHDWVTQSTT